MAIKDHNIVCQNCKIFNWRYIETKDRDGIRTMIFRCQTCGNYLTLTPLKAIKK